MTEITGRSIHISGIVQGVGFRPFVYNLALQLNLPGWVRNTSSGVDILVEGSQPVIIEFVNRLQTEIPPLAKIDQFAIEECQPDGLTKFEIIPSEPIPGAFQPISPDICICQDCVREMFDPTNRRYRYPFINCTNCGPRFTIIKDIPYDRPKTTMAGFTMCPNCQAEFDDPLNRRFHAQPIACPDCGPQVWLEFPGDIQRIPHDDAITMAQQLLAEGKIIAIKGIGGFHIACDATNSEAVGELRKRKHRIDKPFAVMTASLESVHTHCFCGIEEQELLVSRERPIVILKSLPTSKISRLISPGQDSIGMMLPYSPLHYLLLNPSRSGLNPEDIDQSLALVMTSGNISEEPIATTNEAARQRLSGLVDAYLMHDREIHTRCDDSVVRVYSSRQAHPPSGTTNSRVNSKEPSLYPVRRSRGYAPFPVHLPFKAAPLLATGAELKNTFCMTRDDYAFISQHIGDMENYETYHSFETSVDHFEKLYRINPEIIAYDLHPGYLTTRYALERAEAGGMVSVGIQHHHAHIAGCMLENRIYSGKPVIGVAFDGTGYGTDGAIWGGEFLVTTLTNFQRSAHLSYYHLPGGDTAIRKPARIALAYTWQSGIDWYQELLPVGSLCAEERTALRSQLEHQINTINTSSMGRLFDAVAALAGIRQFVNYEAQAAIEFEAIADPNETKAYEFSISHDPSGLILISPEPVIHAVIMDVLLNIPPANISTRFHNGVANMVLQVCKSLRIIHDVDQVALSGGVWQNMTLLAKTYELLITAGFRVSIHRQVPANDGGICLGQAVIAATVYRQRMGLCA